MKKISNNLILRKDDYEYLMSYLNRGWNNASSDRKYAEDLKAELKKANLVNEIDFPSDVVRLNSKVKIKAEHKNAIMELMIVTPDKANLKERKISILAPIGTALLGFREGQKVRWRVPAGFKNFSILEVINED